MLMVAGPNGSGKTTLTRQLIAEGVDLGVYINPDDIAADLAGTPEERTAAAQSEAEARRQRCIRDRRSFTFETVMSHPSKIELLVQASGAGFRVGLFFVATEAADLNVARVLQRVETGGHPVPEDRIRRRYDRSLALLPQAVMLADRAMLFDNSYRLTRSEPVIMRPFALLDIAAPCVMEVEGPIPRWGVQAVSMMMRRYEALINPAPRP